ncbi:DNA translocase FtsK [Jannaschia sp. W003]|uniref:DNA translocase FtsK n=1 Tax=Jannaschia sp. W003 TaxID=2867012 RepID=UPI0021A89E77|nr:DNA translocase FtsK [Jannaschia sp. W003]UWQ21710.1 DNA translocase FtsK 4TM domain-containing protein [Jannaschia sp. W003]
MAYQVRQRDPLLDSTVQITLARRGREGLGVVLVLAGALLGLALWSYHHGDGAWLASSPASPRNWLGLPGATVAAPLMLVVGHGAFALAAAMIVWGVRFAGHWGSERVLPRALFVALWVPVCAVYASSTVPGPNWGHDFGNGGLLGDTVLAMLISLLPIGAAAGLKLLALAVAAGAAILGAWVLGFTREELARFGAFVLCGFGSVWFLVRTGSAAALRGAAGGARGAAGTLRERRAAAAEADDDIVVEDFEADEAPAPRRFLSFLNRTLADAEAAPARAEPPVSDDDRVAGRIASAVRTRVRRAHISEALRPEPVVVPAAAPRTEPVLRRADAAPAAAAEPVAPAAPVAPVRRVPVAPEAPAPRAEPEADDEALFEAPAAFEAVDAPETPATPIRRDRAPAPAPAPAPAEARATPAPAPRPAPAAATDCDFELPPRALLADPASVERHVLPDDKLQENARLLESVLEDYGVKGEIVSVHPGPVVTMYELEPAPGLKASRVIGLADDIARSMSALSARVSTVPGRSVIGIELPNERREKVVLREIFDARDFDDTGSKLALALGKDIGGRAVVADLARMPHLLIAGTTGSGKSVAINTMILSLLYRMTPDECRMIMIDPKMLELSVYDGIPHLLSPVVTDPKKAVTALKWVVGEMEERYRKMSRMGVRNIDGYNGRVAEAQAKGEMFSRTIQTGFDEETGDPVFETEEFEPVKLPYIVVIVDEMADLMMVAGKEIEACIQRLAQMARASGIHLVMATQRPSVDVITGTIKANFPTRISFHVTSKIDSRTILGEMGAEQLLGMGDMLYMAGGSKITRVHGPFCSDEEVEEIVNHLKSFGPAEYAASVLDGPDDDKSSDIDAVLGLTGGNTGGEDALYDQAVAIVAKDRKCSTSYIQRKLGIGYNKAARLVEQMEDEGVVTAANHVGKREILVPEA